MKAFSHGISVLLAVAVLSAVMSVSITQTSAQTSSVGVIEDWVARYGGPEQDDSSDIALDGSGNIYVIGRRENVGTYYDYSTVKYDPNGNQIWDAIYNGPVNDSDYGLDIAVDGFDNVYVTGNSRGNGTDSDYATIKYDTNGNQIWVKRYNGPGNVNDYCRAMVVDDSGYVYVTGTSPGISTSQDYATIKYDTDGNELWVKRYNGPGNTGDEVSATALDGSGNVYVTGGSRGTRCSNTCLDYATIKYDSDGNQLWVARYEPPTGNYGNANAKGIAVDGGDNVYVTGLSDGIGTRDDITTIKYDTNGNELWVKRYNGPGNDSDGGEAIAVDDSGNVYVTGSSHGGSTSNDYTTIKYDTNGNELWVKRYNGPGNAQDIAYAIAVDGSGNVYVTGGSHGSDTSNDSTTIKYDTNGNELWIARYNGPGNDQDRSVALALDGSGTVYVTGYSTGIGTSHDFATIKYVSLAYAPVTPCRVVDTSLAGGPIWYMQSYNVWGDVASQGGKPSGCPSPLGEPKAVYLKLTAVPMYGSGDILAFPYGLTAPGDSLISVSYWDDGQNYASSEAIHTCYHCDKDISVKSDFGAADVKIDVLGYYCQEINYEPEAEKNDFVGAIIIGWTASNDRVGWLGNAPELDSYLEYHVWLHTGGIYNMKIRYVSAEVRQASLRVNGQLKPNISFPSTGDWDTSGLIDVQVELNAGKNTIRFFNENAYAPDFDRIDFSKQ